MMGRLRRLRNDPSAIPDPEADAFAAARSATDRDRARPPAATARPGSEPNPAASRCKVARQPRDPHRHADLDQQFAADRRSSQRAPALTRNTPNTMSSVITPSQNRLSQDGSERAWQHAVGQAAAHRHAEDGTDQSHRQPGLVLVPEARCETLELRLLVRGQCLKRHRRRTLVVEESRPGASVVPGRAVHRTAWLRPPSSGNWRPRGRPCAPGPCHSARPYSGVLRRFCIRSAALPTT